MGGISASGSGGAKNRLGPTQVEGEQRSLQTGSVSTRSPSILEEHAGVSDPGGAQAAVWSVVVVGPGPRHGGHGMPGHPLLAAEELVGDHGPEPTGGEHLGRVVVAKRSVDVMGRPLRPLQARTLQGAPEGSQAARRDQRGHGEGCREDTDCPRELSLHFALLIRGCRALPALDQRPVPAGRARTPSPTPPRRR